MSAVPDALREAFDAMADCDAPCCRCLKPLRGIEAAPWDPEGGYPEAICEACCDEIRGDRRRVDTYAGDIEAAIRVARGSVR